MNENKVLSLNGKDVVIKKIALGKYPQIIKSFRVLSAHKELLGDYSQETIINALPELLLVATPEVLGILALITEQPLEDVNQWGLDDAVKVLEALFDVNDFEYVYSTLKKAMSHLGTANKPMVAVETNL